MSMSAELLEGVDRALLGVDAGVEDAVALDPAVHQAAQALGEALGGVVAGDVGEERLGVGEVVRLLPIACEQQEGGGVVAGAPSTC
jgi:hypothetical protein